MSASVTIFKKKDTETKIQYRIKKYLENLEKNIDKIP